MTPATWGDKPEPRASFPAAHAFLVLTSGARAIELTI